MARKVKKAAALVAEKVEAPEAPVVGKATGVEGKAKKKKVGHPIEISVRVPGYTHRPAAVIDPDKLDAAGRAEALDDLIDQLAACF